MEIRILEFRRGMLVSYVCEALDARMATQLYVFWEEHFSRESLQQFDWLVVDLREVVFMDASGVATLVYLFQQLRAGVPLSLLGCAPEIVDLLRDLRLERLFPQHASIETLPASARCILSGDADVRRRCYRLRKGWSRCP